MTSDSEDKALRYRRAQSVTRAEEITENEKKARKSQLDKPCHLPRDSLFTWSSEFTNFTGLVNWGFLMLSIGGVRLFLENILKYGFRVNPIEWIIVLTGYNEGENSIPERIGIGLQVSNILFVIALPVISLHFKGNTFSSVGMTMICCTYLIIFLKLWSYVQTNYWCRSGKKAKALKTSLRRQSLSAPNWKSFDEDKNGDIAAARLVKYPDNLCLRDLAYFMLAPTLCYELNFPRTARIRKRFVFRRLLELVFGINLIFALLQQWMVPSITNSLETFSSMDFMRITERMLKLAVPNHLIWLCFFYLNFHSFLNLMGELLQFADRKFYGDWWNATNMKVFWSSWNMPVHMWAVRHLYIPITDMGYSKAVAALAVFFVSVPLQMFRVWAFLGMMAQPPLSVISRRVELELGPRWGNIIIWSSLIIGQPLCIMMYYHDYALLNYHK
ncbi:O-acyltransferase [Operophtera brumata]|uniref:O-acyltransferase n=1 Tax=Operophtera brumata TaxID=104452 RepID=A0A0L7L624_OPEBR|nr:O-acyltransferase [Operophtera brumata]